MNTRQQKRITRNLIAGFVLIAIAAGMYFSFRYTLIADLREAMMNPDTADLVSYGETLFQTRGCIGCHTLDMAGAMGEEGPNLTGIANRHDEAYIREAIVNPNAVIAVQCPEGACQSGIMPQFGDILEPAQVDALVAYLISSTNR